jgi:RNA recognition motif-containing protein
MENKLYVGNLSSSVNESDLQILFAQAGVVKSVALISDRDSGHSRGFAFIEMSSVEEAQNAVSMFQGMEFNGRSLIINIARPRMAGDTTTDAPPPDVKKKKRKGK